jgi:substrate-binding family protein
MWLDGYDQTSLAAYPQLMNGVYVLVQHVPFEADAAFPGVYPGMHKYLQTMAKYEPANAKNEVALDGWLNADLFVTGLKLAGPDPTQAKLVKAINKLTGYNGGGLLQPVDWTVAHTKSTQPSCVAIAQAQDGTFRPVFTTGNQVFVCTVDTSDTPIPTPPGTPGGAPVASPASPASSTTTSGG